MVVVIVVVTIVIVLVDKQRAYRGLFCHPPPA
jgi:hypothetical protein